MAKLYVEFKEQNGKKVMVVNSPYHPIFVSRAQKLGGKFKGAGQWIFDARDEDRVREALIDAYGTDGQVRPKLVTLRMAPKTIYARSVFLDRAILSRISRDSRVKLGEGVVILQGGFYSSGGSAKYPQIGPALEGTVIEVRDVPENIANDFVAQERHAERPDFEILEVIPQAEPATPPPELQKPQDQEPSSSLPERLPESPPPETPESAGPDATDTPTPDDLPVHVTGKCTDPTACKLTVQVVRQLKAPAKSVAELEEAIRQVRTLAKQGGIR